MSTELRQVLGLDPGEPKRLTTSELLLAMRQGKLCEAAERLFKAKYPEKGCLDEACPELEDCLDEAWRVARALNLPLSADTERCVVDNLVKIRYKQSTLEKTEAPKTLVDRLVNYSRSLENELKRLQGRGLAPVSARSWMLAMLCSQHLCHATAIFEIKYKSKSVPWEDFHNDLVVFIKALTASTPAAEVNVECLTRSLCNFKAMVGLLEEYELKLKPQTRVTDQSLSALRDWHSLTSKVPAYADAADVRWRELWVRVDTMLKYSESLQDELEQLQVHDPAPGCADKSVMLARLCALAVHNVKRSFLSTYKDVPWEEMEYLLVMFIEERTVYATLAHAKANAKRTEGHLKCFRDRLETHVLVHRALDDPVVAMERLKEELKEEGKDARAAVFAGGKDEKLKKLRKDFTRLRDWHSLKEINKTLEVTKKALCSLDDKAWVAWGWLTLGWALFVVGERVKYSWTCPNLSPRWAHLVEAIAPGGVLTVMSNIRNYQAHGKDSSNALSGMKKKERTKLAEELEKLREAVHVALVKVESEMKPCDESDCDRVDLARSESSDTETLIKEKLLRILEPAKEKAVEDFEEIKSFSDFKTNYSYLWFKSVKLAKRHMPKAVPSVLRLLLYRSMEHTESLYAELQKVTPSVSSPLESLGGALTALAAAPEGQLRDFAVKGAMRELASRWHEHDQVVPAAVPFSPALFGRQLRNYLNHLDEVFSSPLELEALYHLLHHKLIPLEHGARPRLRDLRWSRKENERLLDLVERKSDMFQCAREGYLDDLQCLVEDGADVSARDCQDRTLLHAAAQGGHVHVVEWLLGRGTEAVDPLAVDPLAVDWRGDTALHVADTAAVAEALLAANEAAYLQEGLQQDVWTPLHAAALDGRGEVVNVLRQYPCYLNAGPNDGVTPLYLAALYGHENEVRLLLDVGALYQPYDYNTPLVAAAMSGSAPTVRRLLGHFQTDDEDCWRAAKEAARHGRKDACKHLLGALDKRNLLKWGPHARGVLFSAGVGGSSDITRRLLELSTDALSEKLNGKGDTVLHAAAGAGHTDLVRTLLRLKADPLSKNAGGWTALDSAAKCGSVDTIDALWQITNRIMRKRIKHKRITDDKAKEAKKAALGQALCQAAVFGKLEAVKCLLQHGAKVDAVDEKGRRPLESAVSSGHIEVVECLLRKNANRKLGEIPPLNVAAMMGRLRVVEVLVEEPEPSALRVAVETGSREDLQRILGRFVEHLRPFSRLGNEAEATAALGLTGYLLTFARGIASILRVFLLKCNELVRGGPRCSDGHPGTPNQAPPARAHSKREKEERQLKEREAKLKKKTKQRDKLKELLPFLDLLQQVDDYQKYTALHAAVSVCSLPIVEYLLNQEKEILKKMAKYIPDERDNLTRSVSDFTVYVRDTEEHTALQLAASVRCAPRLAQALLEQMGDSTWMKVGGNAKDKKELRDVRTMAVEALQLAARHPDSGRLVRALCEWISRKGKGLVGAGGLQDIRRRAVAALGSEQAYQVPTAAPSRREGALIWRSVVGLIRWHLAPPPLNLAYLQQCAVLAMRRCLKLGPTGEMALQLLCQWECDLSEDDVPPSKVLLMIGEAMDIARERTDRDSSDVLGAIALSEIYVKMLKYPNGRPVLGFGEEIQ